MENSSCFELELESISYGSVKNVSILGSTGSIGTQSLDIINAHGDKFRLRAISCNRDVNKIIEQAIKYRPEIVCVFDESAYKEAKRLIPPGIKLLQGMDGLLEISSDNEMDILITSVVGNIGLLPTIEAVKKGKRVALANKETLVTSGQIIMPLAKEYGAQIIPVDSEHSAIFQSLQGNSRESVEKIILTASGGPFRGKKKNEIWGMKSKDALKHPNWSMGRKITIDSATLMNKGLEVIEARWLFDMEPDSIEVVIHPQSIIHSMVQYRDSSVMAQLGVPDMKLPILYALSYPDRCVSSLERLDFYKISELTFMRPDMETFPCLSLAYEAIKAGGTLPTVLNAANEVLVEKFLNDDIGFYDIPRTIEELMGRHKNIMSPSVDDILNVDMEIRKELK